MSSPVFYVEALPEADTLRVDGEDGVHAAKVRRIRVGEAVRVADGFGNFADCTVNVVGTKHIECAIHDRGVERRRSPRLSVVQALPKGDRAGLAVEMLTEAGVDEIVPWQSRNCVSRWDEASKAERGRERWTKIAREAAKQSRRARMPVVAALHSTADLLAQVPANGIWLVLHESATAPLRRDLLAPMPDAIHLVIGPEGGLTEAEVDAFAAAGAIAVQLGPQVLRTSTAGVVAATAVSVLTGRWEAS